MDPYVEGWFVMVVQWAYKDSELGAIQGDHGIYIGLQDEAEMEVSKNQGP